MAFSDAFVSYTPANYPQLGDPKLFLSKEFDKLRITLRTAQQVLQRLDTTKTPLVNAASDVAAATAGVPVGGLYHNSGAVRVRLT